MNDLRILVTGGGGYLMTLYREKLLKDPTVEFVLVTDIVQKNIENTDRCAFDILDVRDKDRLEYLVKKYRINTIAHAAWTFNPIHDREKQDAVDISGTQNVLDVVAENDSVQNLIYLGSTTCYGQFPDHPSKHPFPKEWEWNKRVAHRIELIQYPYSQNKARVDLMIQKFKEQNRRKRVFWIRGAIVLGENTNNVVLKMTNLPMWLTLPFVLYKRGRVMFQVKGFDPPMQFVSERDMTNILYGATVEGWGGVCNVASLGTIQYSEVIEHLGRKAVVLPKWFLWNLCWILWKLRLIDFPPETLLLIMESWVGEVSAESNLLRVYKYKPKDSNEDCTNAVKRNPHFSA